MISVKNVSKCFRGSHGLEVEALSRVSLKVAEKEFLSIVGPSGCGKTTLLNLMMGLDAPTGGEILTKGRPPDPRGKQFGYMPQADSLLPWRTVAGNIAVGLELRGIPRDQREERVRNLIERIDLKGFEKSYPHELSGGMSKRVSFARSLAYAPEIIFMDEPFGALDVQTRDILETDILRVWEKNRQTIVFVTHDLVEAVAMSDRVVLMTARPGRIKGIYEIHLPRPRNISEVRLEPALTEMVRALWKELAEEVRKVG